MSPAANAEPNTLEAAPSQTSSAISQEILDRYLPRCKELLSDISDYAASSGKKKKGSGVLPNVIDAKLGAHASLEARVKAALPDCITTQERKRLLEIRTLLEGMLTNFGNQVFKLAMLQGIEVPLGDPILAQGPEASLALPSPSGATSAAADAFEGRNGQAQAAPGMKNANANGAVHDNSADKSNSKSQVCIKTKAGSGAMSGSIATATGAGPSGGAAAAAAAAAAAGPNAANAPAAKPAGPLPHRHYLTASHAAAEQMIRAIDLLLSQPTGSASPRSPKPQRTTATASNGTGTVGTAAAAAAAAAAGPSAAARVLVSGAGTEKTSGGRASTRTKVADEDEGDMEVDIKTAKQASAKVRVSAAAPPPAGHSGGSKSDGDIVAPAPSQRDSMEYWRARAAALEKPTDCLREWLYAHFEAPFPSKDEKQALSEILGLRLSQVSTWFINARVRLWKPKVIMIASELASDSGGAAAAAAAGGDGPASPSVKPNKRPKKASKSGLSTIARNDTVESPLPIAVGRARRNVKQINYAEADAEVEDANAAPADNDKAGGAGPHLKPRSTGRAAALEDEEEEEEEWEGEEEEEEEDYEEEELDPEEDFGP